MIGVRVVYDCMLFLQAVLRPHRTHGTFRVARSGLVRLCVSHDVLSEIRDVLTRPKLMAKSPALTPAIVNAFLLDVATYATVITDVRERYTLARDPKDSKYINLALAAGAEWLVTWDNDLLDLMDGSNPDGRDFVQQYPVLKIVQPPEFLQRVEPAR